MQIYASNVTDAINYQFLWVKDYSQFPNCHWRQFQCNYGYGYKTIRLTVETTISHLEIDNNIIKADLQW